MQLCWDSSYQVWSRNFRSSHAWTSKNIAPAMMGYSEGWCDMHTRILAKASQDMYRNVEMWSSERFYSWYLIIVKPKCTARALREHLRALAGHGSLHFHHRCAPRSPSHRRPPKNINNMSEQEKPLKKQRGKLFAAESSSNSTMKRAFL